MAGYHDLETMCCMEDHHFKVRDRRIGPGSPQADQGPSLVNPTGHGGHPNDKPSMVYFQCPRSKSPLCLSGSSGCFRLWTNPLMLREKKKPGCGLERIPISSCQCSWFSWERLEALPWMFRGRSMDFRIFFISVSFKLSLKPIPISS